MTEAQGRIRGMTATLRWGYHVAATLGRWTFSGSSAEGRLTADLLSLHPFRMTQAPLSLDVTIDGGADAILRAAPHLAGAPWLAEIADRGPSVLRWPVRALTHDGAVATIDVGAAEKV